jgi:hypothetical protein
LTEPLTTAAAIATVDRRLARTMIRDLAADYRINGVNEYVAGPDSPTNTHCIGYRNYGPGIALPLQALETRLGEL